MAEAEYCLVIVKPGGLKRGHVGDIISRIEHEGFTLLSLKLLTMTRRQVRLHYGEWAQQPWFCKLLAHMTSGPSVVILLEGDCAKLERLVGKTDPTQAEPGTLRQLYGVSITDNGVHTSSPGLGDLEMRRFWSIHQRFALGLHAWWRRAA